MKKEINRNRIRQTSECGILIAVAMALSFVKIIQLPSGGSVSLGALPILLIASRRGFKVGAVSGLCLSLLLLMNGAFVIHPLQFLLDYPLAYASLGVAGIIKWDTPLKAATATTVANLIRLQFHVVAGAVFFSDAEENLSKALAYSYAYNCGHLIPETIICAAIMWYIALKHQKLCSRQSPC